MIGFKESVPGGCGTGLTVLAWFKGGPDMVPASIVHVYFYMDAYMHVTSTNSNESMLSSIVGQGHDMT